MRILIAEGDEFLRELLADFLSELGHKTIGAENGRELVKLALSERPELVIADLYMPEMAGGSMIAMLDIYQDLAGIPIILITGATPLELSNIGIPKEIPILPKPFDFAKVVAVVDRVTRR